MSELTPAEQAFFASGELPPELAAQQAPATPPSPQPQTASAEPPPAAFDPVESLRRTAAEAQAREADALARLRAMETEMAAKAAPQTPAPDPNVDPLGAMMHQLKEVSNAVVAFKQQQDASTQQSQQLAAYNEFRDSIREIRDAYTKTVPDFDSAYQHLRDVRGQDLKDMGATAAQVKQLLLQDELNLSQQALRTGKNPAEVMYTMAKRYGYVPKAAGNPAPGPKSDSTAPKLDAIAKGMAGSAQPPAAAPDTTYDVESLKAVSSRDLDKMVQDDDVWAKLIGGNAKSIF